MKEPYSVLGLSADATEEELKARYEELKAEYGEQRFKSGEEGNEGARKLSELESAWAMICADLDKKQARETYGDGDYGVIDDLIKKGDYTEAQNRLDAISDRTAQWHYFQSIVFYKREWLNDSRKQLALAVEMDPANTKYKTALEKLDMILGNPKAEAQNMGYQSIESDYSGPSGGGQGSSTNQNRGDGSVCGGNALSNCCLAYCITDCCCSLMSGCCR